MDEHAEPLYDEDDQQDDKRDERFERPLTQRELVRASLLRCPPAPPDDHPRH